MSSQIKPWHFAALALALFSGMAGHHALIKIENAKLLEQFESMAQQLEQQAEDHEQRTIQGLRDRRYELINLIYGKAPTSRTRAEAVRELIEIERARGAVPILRGAPLKELDFRDFDLQEVDLREANLDKADLSQANLSNAKLNRAELHGADIRSANLGGADIGGARLGFSDYFHQDVKNLTQSQIEAANGDSRTTLPKHLKQPAHWAPP